MTVGVATIRLVMQFIGGSHLASVIALGAAIIVSMLLADVLNRCVELPAMRLSKRFKTDAYAAIGWPRFEPALSVARPLPV
jgi:peptidoglycan/LPS O-acetylase OafA/YrhL